ncbi:HAD family hydrolase [Paraburkholderia sp. CNPSo 3272]|uniref:HAD family hydrolase n=1 Tax=Paraburkholderia sp. CNPSo 3272 TaxID=2940931 RepID=UPI0020B8FFDA|nr:HAD family hydrolase [Paraburkholderia sp. CNPSo 3272]MCP3728066.1 HAD family hydrolase [Paraburkholderia sp. CNPSo 3272]
MFQAIVFDIDGTLVDSVDLHALAWQEAFRQFGHSVSFEQARSQIGKGGDQLIPTFLSDHDIADHGAALEEWRSARFKSEYLASVRPFSCVPELFLRARDAGLKIAVASSAKEDELQKYLEIAGVTKLIDAATSSSDADRSKPAPDIFEAVLAKLHVDASNALAVGDSPYDAQAANKTGLNCIRLLCGGFIEKDLRAAGCIDVYPGPAALYACFDWSPLSCDTRSPVGA